MKTKKSPYIGLIILFVVLITSCNESKDLDKIVYIESQEVIDSFKMTEDLYAQFEHDIETLTTEKQGVEKEIDEFSIRFKSGQNTMNDQQIKRLQRAYNLAVQRLEEIEINISNREGEIQAKIAKRLDGYIAQYAEEKNLDFILGANGNGTMLYGKSTKNVTKELIEFVNNNYEGK